MISIKITDRKSGEAKVSSGTMEVGAGYIHKGNPQVPVVMKLPLKDLPAGAYRLDVVCGDSLGKQITRSADLEVQGATAPAVGWDKN